MPHEKGDSSPCSQCPFPTPRLYRHEVARGLWTTRAPVGQETRSPPHLGQVQETWMCRDCRPMCGQGFSVWLGLPTPSLPANSPALQHDPRMII